MKNIKNNRPLLLPLAGIVVAVLGLIASYFEETVLTYIAMIITFVIFVVFYVIVIRL